MVSKFDGLPIYERTDTVNYGKSFAIVIIAYFLHFKLQIFAQIENRYSISTSARHLINLFYSATFIDPFFWSN